MKKAEEVRQLQKEKMQSHPRYKDLETEVSVLIDRAIDTGEQKATVNIKADEIPLAMLLATSYGYKWSYFPAFDKDAITSFDITW